ncbi:DUF2336 domain-containing protein [Hwanghaeella sp.]|uniref:DUF2336 domain-containing protein n=1 Tax=Hwanghaeella sp. TaxID=2605943 RepID=UPI003CCBB500
MKDEGQSNPPVDDDLSLLPEDLSYEQSKKLLRDSDPNVRRALARHPGTRPEVLYYLAEDSSNDVRLEIASNERTPRQADLLLANDRDDDIRTALATKIAKLTPALRDEDRGALYDYTIQVLEKLAQDQIVRVRQIMAEALKDVADAPHSVIQQLASDAELVVSGPILRFSPVLTDTDLLSIIKAGAVQGKLVAISERSEVSGDVADAIVDAGDDETIAVLLANGKAQIREETLDALTARSEKVVSWHAPLVARPALSMRSARMLAGFVAEHLLAKLQAREDLEAATLEAVAEVVAERLGEGSGKQDVVDPEWAQDDVSEEEIQRLKEAGALTEPAIVESLEAGRKRFVEAALACLAEVPREAAARIVAQRSGKALVALAWKAGMSTDMIGPLQVQLMGLPPSKIVIADDPDLWPMSEEDMDWQLDFFLNE